MDDKGPYTVCIAEDEAPARELLIDYCCARDELKLAAVAKTGDEALSRLVSEQFDLAIMDIHLPRCSGIQVLERLKAIPHVIFTTAHERYAVRAFEIGAVDYLLKPFSMERFNLAVDKFLAGRRLAPIRTEVDNSFSFKMKGKHRILPVDDIYFITSHGKHSVVHTASGDYEIPEAMKCMEVRLPARSFVRIHKRHIVNVRYLEAVEYYGGGQYLAFLKDGDETSLPVGRNYAPILKIRLGLD